ncbi:MAG: beta-L-arabinofuranosidase domain-containing protein, partial [Burkholderiales bacterium]
MNTKTLSLLLVATVGTALAEPITPVPEKISCTIADRQDFQIPDLVQLTGWVGSRIAANESNRLVKIDPARLLEGYRKRPGRQTWDGEHVGKWLHAATLAWVYTGDPALRAKLDDTVAELCKCQLADGYLGTYLEKDRWTEWDVWAHKYNLIGLITYMRYTGNMTPLPTCRRMADLLCKTFGDQPDQRDIIKAGHHVGMAPTSVLEPMVLLYRLTGETRYLDFCKYILRAWEQPNGPQIVSRLLDGKGVNKVGNGKAYEMLSCLNGALEFYRTTGDRQILDACLNAWQDIVDKRLYLTGAASYHELFHDDYDLPNVASVGETCVTVTWLQFNAQLLRLTGEARFAEQLEKVVLNQLLGAQRPDCAAWGYYVQMEGKKPYSDSLDGHCCLSSGPRGVALIPAFAASTDADGVVMNLYDASTARLKLRDGLQVSLTTETRYPSDGRIRITVNPAEPKAFAVKVRIPTWCRSASVAVNGSKLIAKPAADGYVAIQRTWTAGDKIELNFALEPRVVIGDHHNQGKVALDYGPLVLCADEALLPDEVKSLAALTIANPDLTALAVTPEPATEKLKTWPGAQIFRIKTLAQKTGVPVEVRLIPFADAGGTGSRYKVWLPLPRQSSGNLLLEGVESRSRPGNQPGSIIDEELQSPVVTFDGQPSKEDWFAVTLDVPIAIRRVVFMHGNNFHDGGWFDAGAGKPKVQIQRAKGGAWETVGELADYPATTATNNGNLKFGQAFTLRLASPAKALAVRVLG